jgi:hypothetical protein
MSTSRKLDPALKNMLHDLASGDPIAAMEPSDAQQRKIAALRDCFARLKHTNPAHFKPGDVVRWQPGLKYMTLPAYGEPMVVVEVLVQPVFDAHASTGSSCYRSPLSLVLGMPRHGKFFCWHFDGRRFEVVPQHG